MSSQILLRGVPENLREWLEQQRYEQRLSLREMLLSILNKAYKGEDQMPLFDNLSRQQAEPPRFVPFSFIDFAIAWGIDT